MAELDFSKIFGETATSKASFTDENYLNGWGYLGSAPPPYQLFDYLQSLNDQKSKYLYDKVNENDNNLSIHNTNATAHADIRQMFNSYLTVQESETKLSAHNTDSSAHTAILNAIKAISGMSAYDIAPSKTITAMIPLLGLGGIVAQRLEDNGYVKFASGFTIQWGKSINGYVTFPIAYLKTRVIVTNHQGNQYFDSRVVENNSLTGFTLSVDNNQDNYTDAQWISLGS